MKSKMIFSGLGILAGAVAVILILMDRSRGTGVWKQGLEVGSQEWGGGRQADKQILKTAMDFPETFQQTEKSVVTQVKIPDPLSVPTSRSQQLSEIEKPTREHVRREPVAVESLYFWTDYKSLRKDEIRNPDSKENREGVVTLLTMRQRRSSSENTK